MNVLVASEPVTAPLQCTIITSPLDIAEQYGSFHHDESKLHGGPVLSLSFPRTYEEVSFILSNNFQQQIPTTVSGARTGITGGAVPGKNCHVLSLAKMLGVDELNTSDAGKAYVRVRGGTPLAALNAVIDEQAPDFFFPVDPTETSASVAGMVSTNASGARSYHYGSVRPWVRWIRVVLPDGSILELTRGAHKIDNGVLVLEQGGERRTLEADSIPKPQTKNTLGYTFTRDGDPIDLFIGAEGTLGVVTDVELALIPRPAARLYFLQLFSSEEAALDFVEKLRGERSLQTLAIEFFDERSLRLVQGSPAAKACRAVAAVSEHHRAGVYTEVVFPDEEQLGVVYETLEALLASVGESIESSIAGIEDKELRDLKLFRHAVPETVNALIASRRREVPGLHKIATDMAVPSEHLKQIFKRYKEGLEGAALDYCIFGHAGDNHFHVNILPRSAAELESAKKLYLEFAEQVVALGGAVSAEHGIGRVKKQFLAVQYSAAQLDEQRKIKRFFDPSGLLNPDILL